MNAKTVVMSVWPVLGAALVACTLYVGAVAAKDPEFTVAYQVSTQGLDLSQPAGAQEFYSRLRHAAEIVCTHGMRVDLNPVANKNACCEKWLGDAIRSVNLPLLTQVHLATHTLQQAAARRIYAPAQISMVPQRETP